MKDRFNRFVTKESTGGILLLAAAAIALILANSPLQSFYADLSALRLGPAALHLDLPLSLWAADGLLAVFFFVVGVELKHELFAGSLRQPKEAAVPVFAAIGGMLAPAVLFVALLLALGDPAAWHGWAIPTATDIAFALAVLAIFGRGLPRALRTFLLTLAVVDDLLAIIVIAAFYTASIHPVSLFASVAAIAVFGLLVRIRRHRWWLLIPVGVVAWAFMHASGIHATIAGVALGFTVPAFAIHDETESRTHQLDDAVRPFSAAFALPVFAFFAAGVTLTGGSGTVFDQPVFLATLVALVAGKLLGVMGATALVTRFTPFRLPDSIGLRDLLPIGFLCGIGFTVSLLITELSYDDGTHFRAAKVGILAGSLLAAVLGAALLRWDARTARTEDMNRDDIPDQDTGLIGDDPGD
ncbi:MAG: Na+/H+ antiporter NhaA [Propionibacteriaceae bacterium]|nr:Na+/H+ antiporter NhaA [Propionibacteriaceae bacterium]